MIGSRKKLNLFRDFGSKFHLNGHYLKDVYRCKFGVILDPKLTWGIHIEHVRRKILIHLFFFVRQDHLLMKMLHFTIIQSHRLLFACLEQCNKFGSK